MIKNGVLTFAGTITRKEGSTSTTIDFTSCRTDPGCYPVSAISAAIGVVTSISPVKPKGIFWIVDNKPDPGLIVIIR